MTARADITTRERTSRTMHGRTALALILGSLALAGCGAEPKVQPASIKMTESPPAAEAVTPPKDPLPAAKARVGGSRSGTFKSEPIVEAPPSRPAAVPVRRVRSPRRTKRSYARFRESQLRVLRAHCATRPEDDPRCIGDRVDERVAFAAFEDRR